MPKFKRLGNEPGDQCHKMFKNGFFDPNLKHFNYAMGCPDKLYKVSIPSCKKDFASRQININNLNN